MNIENIRQSEKPKLFGDLLVSAEKFAEKKRKETKTTGRPVIAKGDKLFYLEKNKEIKTTIGEIIASIDWGNNFYLKPESVPEDVRKEYQKEETKHEEKNLSDLRTIIEKVNEPEARGCSSQTKNKYGAYFRIIEGLGKDPAPGIIAEKIIENLLRQISIDNDLGFRIEDSNVEEDVEGKIDFFIIASERKIGIQITTNMEAGAEKSEQIERAKEVIKWSGAEKVVLVKEVFGADTAKFLSDIYKLWKDNGRKPGGPEKLLSAEKKNGILLDVLSETGLFSESELAEKLEKVKKHLK